LLRATQWCNQILILLLGRKITGFSKPEIVFHALDVSFFVLILRKVKRITAFCQKKSKSDTLIAKKRKAVRPA